MAIQIDHLADYPQYIETLAPWIHDYWQPLLRDETIDARIKKLRNHMSHTSLPIALVAHDGTQVYGTAALRVHDLPGREDLSPWLGGVFVGQTYRRQGIGSKLCHAVEQKAAELFGNSNLYLFTLDQQSWYQGLGWSFHETCDWMGHEGDIMTKQIVGE